jgi:hypothetical protein
MSKAKALLSSETLNKMSAPRAEKVEKLTIGVHDMRLVSYSIENFDNDEQNNNANFTRLRVTFKTSSGLSAKTIISVPTEKSTLEYKTRAGKDGNAEGFDKFVAIMLQSDKLQPSDSDVAKIKAMNLFVKTHFPLAAKGNAKKEKDVLVPEGSKLDVQVKYGWNPSTLHPLKTETGDYVIVSSGNKPIKALSAYVFTMSEGEGWIQFCSRCENEIKSAGIKSKTKTGSYDFKIANGMEIVKFPLTESVELGDEEGETV